MKTACIIAIIGTLIATITGIVPPAKPTQAETSEAKVAEKIAQSEEKPIEARPIDLPWEVKTSVAGGHVDKINAAIATYKAQGLTKEGAAYIVGNFLQEKTSAFITGDPCGGLLGDGGLAHGYGQWHPGRRADMPCDSTAQLIWALNVEMPRDAKNNGYGCLCDALRGNDVGLITKRIKQWERYGHEGYRFDYGAQILDQLQ